jgi:MoaA/NifB/PqqE/SkfB family radical SAM enzyme
MKKTQKYNTPLSKIETLTLEMGYQCNIRCSFCYQEDFSPKNNAPDELWKEKLLSVYPSLKRVTFLGGEPTIIKGAKEFSDFIVKKYPHIKLDTITNGLAFKGEWIDKFVSNGHKIIFSLNAASAEVYDKVTKNSNWEKVIANIENLVAEKRKASANLILEASMLVLPENIAEMGSFVELCAELGFDKAFFITPLFHQIKNIDRDVARISIKEASDMKVKYLDMKVVGIESIAKNLFPEPDAEIVELIERVGERDEREPSYYDNVCKYPWNSLYVKHTGDVMVCCAAWFAIGNLKKSSIEDIWNSSKALDMRKKMAKKDYSLCKRICPFNENPSKKSKESLNVVGRKIVYRIIKDPRMAVKKIKKEMGRFFE